MHTRALIGTKKSNVLGVLLLSAISLTAQNAEYSPYSRFGFGLIGSLQTPVHAGMGGMESVLYSSYQFNTNNPASASALSQTTFQASSILSQLKMSDGIAEDATARFGSAGPLSIAIKKQGGQNTLIIGVSPYSNSGFAVSRSTESEAVGRYEENYDGNGGLSKALIGWARTLRGKGYIQAGLNDSVLVQTNTLHLGIQTQYLFGSVSRTSSLNIIDPTFLDHRSVIDMEHRSISADIGWIYNHLLFAKYNKDKGFEKSASLRFGGRFTPQTSLFSDIARVDETTQNFGGINLPLDTALFIASSNVRGKMPSSWNTGLAFILDHANGSHIGVGIEYSGANWDKIESEFDTSLLPSGLSWVRSETFKAGVEWTLGNPEQRNDTWGKANYRLGFSRVEQPYEINSNQLIARSLSAGFSLPLIGSRSLSRFHFGMEIGERYTESDGLNENFARLHIGFSLMPFFKNNWLRERLYD
jgi:hypothetical protein